MRNQRFDFLHLPDNFHKQHKTCEFLLYQIEDFILKNEYKSLKVQSLELDEKINLLDVENVLDYLNRLGKVDKHDEIITSHILNAIIADTCQFLQIALFSSLQARLTVVFALIRKPFVYNLLLILRLYFTTDFLEKFNTEECFDTTDLTRQDIIELISFSENVLYSKSISATDVYDFVFNPSLPDSLMNMSNKALHPSTTRNKNNRTEIQNLNFVFSSLDSINSQWDYLYRRLPFLLLYLNEVLEFILFDHLKLNNDIYAERLIERANFFEQNNSY